jgi:hypothetical protein
VPLFSVTDELRLMDQAEADAMVAGLIAQC